MGKGNVGTVKKPEAVITCFWDGDTYIYSLVVDGKRTLSAYTRDELIREIGRIGAVLKEGGPK